VRIERHQIDETRLSEMKGDLDGDYKRLLDTLQTAKRYPGNLSQLISASKIVAAQELLFDPRSSRGRQALHLAARASASLFAARMARPDNSVTVALEERGGLVTYTSPPDESTVTVGTWVRGFYFGAVARDRAAMDLLCRTDPEALRGSSTRSPDYMYLYAKSLRDYHTRQWDRIVENMMAAFDATDPERPDVYDKDWALHLHVPQLEVLIYAVTRDARFADALRRAVELHKKYWSSMEDFRMQSFEGLISIPLSGLARIGLDQGLRFDVESPYIPRELLGQF